MQGIYIHISETNHVPREYTVAAILSLLFLVPLSLVPALALLYFYVSTFRSMCAVPNMAVFCSSLTSWCPFSFRKYMSNIPGHHDVKELQKTAILGTAHILRKVLTQKYKRSNTGTKDRGIINSNDRIAATVYSPGI